MPSKPPLSVSFHNFGGDVGVLTSSFTKVLSEAFDLTIAAEGRDLQMCGVYGTQLLPEPRPNRRALRVWYSGEVRDPLHQMFDLYFGFRPSNPLFGSRWHRYPLWILYVDWWNPQALTHISRLTSPRIGVSERSLFCNFIYTAPAATRAEFFLRLHAKRQVGALGKILNNRGGERAPGMEGKMRALADSQFTIAFENQVSAGYVTEKLVEPLLAGSIPIYWGAAEAKADFNPNAFIFAEDCGTFEDLVTHVLRVADSRDALAELATAPPFRDNRPAYEHTPAYFVDRVKEALSGDADAVLPRQLIAPIFDVSRKRSAKYRLRQLRDRLLGRRLARH